MITMSLLLLVAVCLTADLQRRHERILRAAILKSGQTMLQASQEAAIDKGQFTRQVQLIEGSHKRLAMQPDAFWRWYGLLLLHEFGMPVEVETAVQLSLELV